MGNSCDLGILFRHTLSSVNNHNDHICTLYSGHRADNAVTLQFLFDLILPAQSGSVDKYILSALIYHLGIHGISGSSGNIRHDHTVLTG